LTSAGDTIDIRRHVKHKDTKGTKTQRHKDTKKGGREREQDISGIPLLTPAFGGKQTGKQKANGDVTAA